MPNLLLDNVNDEAKSPIRPPMKRHYTGWIVMAIIIGIVDIIATVGFIAAIFGLGSIDQNVGGVLALVIIPIFIAIATAIALLNVAFVLTFAIHQQWQRHKQKLGALESDILLPKQGLMKRSIKGILLFGLIFAALIGVTVGVYFWNAHQLAQEQDRKLDEIDAYYENLQRAYITDREASQLLQGCKLIGFYYPREAEEYTATGRPPTGNDTGIELDWSNQPTHIHLSREAAERLIPIAREAQKKCPSLQFWADGRYEQRDNDGNWK